jgi:hypothetical protein
MNTGQKIGLALGVLVTAVGVYLGSQPVAGSPVPSGVVDYGCRQTLSTQTILITYSGNQAYTVFQWGFAAFDAITGTGYSANGKGKSDPLFCGSPINIVGDCWQSVTRLAASPDVPKWLVATGAPDLCTEQGLAVWKWNPGINRYAWYGFINGTINRLKEPKLDGDFAYAVEQAGPAESWMKFDLTTKAVVAGNLPEPVTPPRQSNIQGYTYSVLPILPDPPSPKKFTWTRHGGPSVTQTPTTIPTVTPSGANPYAAWAEELFHEGVTAGCGPGLFCPDQPLTRAQAAVWLLKSKHGEAYLPPPCVGLFADTPCGETGVTFGPTIGPAPSKTNTPHIGPASTKTNTPHFSTAPTKTPTPHIGPNQ